MKSLNLKLEFTAQDARQNPYPLIPFEVPVGTRGIRVTQLVKPDEAVIDLGLADTMGVRGWSGGARGEFSVTPSDATPGYQAGVLRPGTHFVLLGLYHLPEGGAGVELSFEFFPEGPLQWLRGDLHCHTWHSDAQGSPAQLAAAARDRGLNFVAVADHNTVSHHAHLDDPILLAAQEVTTYKGHFVAHGQAPLLDFRITSPEAARTALAQAQKYRLLTVLAHPVPTCPSCDWAWGMEEQFDAIEVWNGPWLSLNWIAREKWLTLLDRGLKITPVGGSDCHKSAQWPEQQPDYLQVGSPTTWIKASSSHPGDLYAGILAGRTCVSADPAGPVIELYTEDSRLHYQVSGPPGGEFTVFAGREAVYSQPFKSRLNGEIPLIPGRYYRAEITAPTPPEQAQVVLQRWPQYVRPEDITHSLRALSAVI